MFASSVSKVRNIAERPCGLLPFTFLVHFRNLSFRGVTLLLPFCPLNGRLKGTKNVNGNSPHGPGKGLVQPHPPAQFSKMCWHQDASPHLRAGRAPPVTSVFKRGFYASNVRALLFDKATMPCAGHLQLSPTPQGGGALGGDYCPGTKIPTCGGDEWINHS